MRTLMALSLLLLVGTLGPASPSALSKNDQDLPQLREDLLVSYAKFKQYGSADPTTTYGTLSPDRRAVFEAAIRALFLPIVDNQNKLGPRVIDYVDEVRGIWGARIGETQGRYVFRMSLHVRAGLSALLKNSSNIPPGDGGHVMVSKPTGGDDEKGFKDFKSLLKGPFGVITFREAAWPSLQVSLIDDKEPQVGEVDVDFDKPVFRPPLDFCGCHCQPSNSDVGSAKPSSKSDVHLTMLNERRMPDNTLIFSTPLKISGWSQPEKHCKNSY